MLGSFAGNNARRFVHGHRASAMFWSHYVTQPRRHRYSTPTLKTVPVRHHQHPFHEVRKVPYVLSQSRRLHRTVPLFLSAFLLVFFSSVSTAPDVLEHRMCRLAIRSISALEGKAYIPAHPLAAALCPSDAQVCTSAGSAAMPLQADSTERTSQQPSLLPSPTSVQTCCFVRSFMFSWCIDCSRRSVSACLFGRTTST